MTDELRGGGATPGALHIVSTPIGNLADLDDEDDDENLGEAAGLLDFEVAVI